MRCHPSALAGKAALEAAVDAELRTVVELFGGRELKVKWTRVGASEDTLQRVLPLLLNRLEPLWGARLFEVCKPSPPPDLDAPFLHRLSRLARPTCCAGWASRPARAVVDLHALGRVVPSVALCPRASASLPLTAHADAPGVQPPRACTCSFREPW